MGLTPHETQFIQDYCRDQVTVMKMLLPQLTTTELEWAVSSAIDEFLVNPDVKVYNNYTKQELSSTLLGLIDYIKRREPVMTPSGVMFAKPGTVANPVSTMLMGFLTNRKKMKKKMFEYPKGTAEFAKYSLLQLLLKLNR